jgi:hypothetical protein
MRACQLAGGHLGGGLLLDPAGDDFMGHREMGEYPWFGPHRRASVDHTSPLALATSSVCLA